MERNRTINPEYTPSSRSTDDSISMETKGRGSRKMNQLALSSELDIITSTSYSLHSVNTSDIINKQDKSIITPADEEMTLSRRRVDMKILFGYSPSKQTQIKQQPIPSKVRNFSPFSLNIFRSTGSEQNSDSKPSYEETSEDSRDNSYADSETSPVKVEPKKMLSRIHSFTFSRSSSKSSTSISLSQQNKDNNNQNSSSSNDSSPDVSAPTRSRPFSWTAIRTTPAKIRKSTPRGLFFNRNPKSTSTATSEELQQIDKLSLQVVVDINSLHNSDSSSQLGSPSSPGVWSLNSSNGQQQQLQRISPAKVVGEQHMHAIRQNLSTKLSVLTLGTKPFDTIKDGTEVVLDQGQEPRIIQFDTQRKSDHCVLSDDEEAISEGHLSGHFQPVIEEEIDLSQFPKDGIALSVLDDFIEACGGKAALEKLTTADVCEKFVKPLTLAAKCSFCELLKKNDQEKERRRLSSADKERDRSDDLNSRKNSSTGQEPANLSLSRSSRLTKSGMSEVEGEGVKSLKSSNSTNYLDKSNHSRRSRSTLSENEPGASHLTTSREIITKKSTSMSKQNELELKSSRQTALNSTADTSLSSDVHASRDSRNTKEAEVSSRLTSNSPERPRKSRHSRVGSNIDNYSYLARPRVKEATVFVSHAWQFLFLDVVDALQYHFEGGSEGVYLWFDLFSNDQHSATSLDFGWWSTTFKSAIAKIGHTVLILAPWDNPIPLRRAWCLFEIYSTVESKCLFQVAMSRQEQKRFIVAIQQGYEVVNKMIAVIDAERSESWNPQDKDRIFEVVKRTVGFNEINACVCEQMRDWVISTTKVAIEREKQEQVRYTLQSSLGQLYYGQGRYLEAEPLFEECVQWMRTKLGDEDPITLENIDHLGNLYLAQAKYDEAEPLYTENLRLRCARLGEDHPDTLISLDHLANLYYNQKKYSQVLPLFLQCYEKRRANNGPAAHQTLSSMNNLALLYFRLDRYDEAETLYQECLQHMRATLGPFHPDRLYCMNCLASLYSIKKEYGKAAPLFADCLEATITKLGHEHPNTLDSMNNLGIVYKNLKRYDLAEPLLVKCLDLRWNKLGKSHPDTLNTLDILAIVYEKQGNLMKAQTFLQQCYEVRKERYGPTHRETLQSLSNLALILEKNQDCKEAEQLLIECLEIRMATLGPTHKDTLASMNNLAACYFNQKLYNHSTPLYEKVYENRHVELGPNHSDTLRAMHNLAISYQKCGRGPGAVELFKNCYRMRKEKLGETHPDTVLTRKYLLAAMTRNK